MVTITDHGGNQIVLPLDTDPNATTSDFIAVINWGDNTTSPGTVVANAGGGPGFEVDGPASGHTYLDEGTFPVTVTITDKGGSIATATTTAIMADTDNLSATGGPAISGNEGTAINAANLATLYRHRGRGVPECHDQ